MGTALIQRKTKQVPSHISDDCQLLQRYFSPAYAAYIIYNIYSIVKNFNIQWTLSLSQHVPAEYISASSSRAYPPAYPKYRMDNSRLTKIFQQPEQSVFNFWDDVRYNSSNSSKQSNTCLSIVCRPSVSLARVLLCIKQAYYENCSD